MVLSAASQEGGGRVRHYQLGEGATRAVAIMNRMVRRGVWLGFMGGKVLGGQQAKGGSPIACGRMKRSK